MKWFKHDTNARNDIKIKLLKAKYGAEGYGVYFQLVELVTENIKEQNIDEWGLVESVHTTETLAIECGVPTEVLRSILQYCNEIGLIYRVNDRLCVPKVLRRLNDHFTRKAREADNFNVHQRETELLRSTSVGTTDKEKKRKEEKRKEGGVGETEKTNGIKTKAEYNQWLKAYNDEYGTNFRSQQNLDNYAYWRKSYTQEELIQVIPKVRQHDWLSDKRKPELILRQRDTKGNPVDRIGELLSLKVRGRKL